MKINPVENIKKLVGKIINKDEEDLRFFFIRNKRKNKSKNLTTRSRKNEKIDNVQWEDIVEISELGQLLQIASKSEAFDQNKVEEIKRQLQENNGKIAYNYDKIATEMIKFEKEIVDKKKV